LFLLSATTHERWEGITPCSMSKLGIYLRILHAEVFILQAARRGRCQAGFSYRVRSF
jgi:hypothetical protein